MTQEPDFGSSLPDTFADLGDTSYGTAIDDYQAQMDDFDLKGPNAQFLSSNANYDEEGSRGDNGSNAALDEALEEIANLEKEIEDLENASAGLNGCSPIFFNDNSYNTISGSVCVSSREDGKIDIVWGLTSSSRLAPGGGASGQYSFIGNIKNASGGFVGSVNSTNGPYCPFQWQQDQTFTKSASGTGVSGGTIHPTASYIDWFVAGNPAAGRSYL